MFTLKKGVATDKGVSSKEEKLIMMRDELRGRKAKLLAEIDKLREDEELAIAQSVNRKEMNSLFRRLPIGWIDSVYCTRRDKIVKHVSSTLSTYNMRRDICRLKLAGPDEYYKEYQYYAVICEAVVPTSQGVVLFIRDPYRKMHTQPLKKTSIEQAQNWVGLMLVVKAHITEDQFTNDELYIERIKVLKYTRDAEKKLSGNFEKIPSFLAKEFEFYRGIFGQDKCKEAQKNIGYSLKLNNWEEFDIEPAMPYYYKNGYRCRVFSKSDIMEVVWENNVVITDIDRMVGNLDNPEFNILISSENCLCFEPTMEDV